MMTGDGLYPYSLLVDAARGNAVAVCGRIGADPDEFVTHDPRTGGEAVERWRLVAMDYLYHCAMQEVRDAR